MKKIYLLFYATFLLSALSLDAANLNFSGVLSSNTTWNYDTVKVNSDVTINSGVTLTIASGTYIQFQGHYKLDVKGRILAQGTASNKITFTALNQSTGWAGIRFENTNVSNDTSVLEYCVLSYGKANSGAYNDKSGGAIFMYNYSKLVVKNCILSNNYASYYGGAICLRYNASPQIINNLMVNNTASSVGGAMLIYSGSQPNLINNTIAYNTSSNGGAIYAGGYTSGIVSNCIIYGNTANSSSQIYGTIQNISNCNIEGGYTYGNNILDTVPGFVSPPSGAGNSYDGLSANFALSSTSPMIDMGINQVMNLGLGNFDLNGDFRFDNAKVDIGAYEYISSTEVCGTISSNTTWSGSILLNCDVNVNSGATLTIQAGTKIIATGPYVLKISGRLLAQGTQDNYIEMKAWNIDEGWRGIYFYNVASSNDTSKIEYCKISNKKELNHSTYYFGAIYAYQAPKLLIRNNIISNNYSKYGAGITLKNSSVDVVGNLIVNNQSKYFGGAVFVYGSSSNQVRFINNTITKNKTLIYSYAGGLYKTGSPNLSLINNIIYFNEDNGGNSTTVDNVYPSSGLNITYSCVQGSYPGTGNISTNPNFKNESPNAGIGYNTNNYNFSLTPSSSCIDAGSSTSANLNLPTLDLAGKTRNYSASIDMGAYEDKSSLAVCGNITSDQVWDANVISIGCDVTIASGATVSINPGTKVLFTGHYKITVNGALHALGLEGDTITFTASNTSIGWDGIFINNPSYANDSTLFDYCRFEYAKRTPTTYKDGGGAISNYVQDAFRLTHSIFEHNDVLGSYGKGSAISSYFMRNTAQNISIKHNIFANNNGKYAVVNLQYSNVDFLDNSIYYNTVTSYSPLVLSGCGGNIFFNEIVNNSGPYGAVRIDYSYNNNIVYLYNNIVANNSGTYTGGISVNDTKPFIYNNTITNNYCSNFNYAGGLYFINNADANLKNNIIYGNRAVGGLIQQICINDVAADPKFYNNDIEGGLAAFNGSGSGINYSGVVSDNINQNPSFTSPSSAAGSSYNARSADWSIGQGSALINTGYAGILTEMTDFDINGNDRTYNGRIDIGAIENQDPIVAPCTINNDVVWEADTIRVNCNITVSSMTTLTIKPGTYVLFTGHYGMQIDGNIVAEGTYDNPIVFSINDTTGFWDSTVTTGGWDGINFNSVLPTNDSSKFEYCQFNFAKATGTSYQDKLGGAFNIYNSPKIAIRNCVISNNYAYTYGGGLYVESSNILFQNNVIANNQCAYMGAGAYFDDCTMDLVNLSVVNNWARYTGGIQINGSEVNLKNSIFWGNRAWVYSYGTYSQLGFYSSGLSKVYNCDIEYGLSRIVNGSQLAVYQNCLNTDPKFVNPSQGLGYRFEGATSNWGLLPSSPLLNNGLPSTSNMVSLDLVGNTRLVADTIDIGAYEIQISQKFIDVQPSDMQICLGTSANLVSHAIIPASYTWQKNGVNIGGSTSKILALNNVSLADSGYYNCIIGNSDGSISTDTVFVQIQSPPTVTTSPQSTSECLGSSITLTAAASGTEPINYQWYNTNGQLQSGSSSQSYDIGSGSLTNTGNSYPAPFSNYYWGAKQQFLIKASELTALNIQAGDISSIGFNVIALNACPTLSNFEIKIGSTTASALTSTWLTGLTSVYSVASYQPNNGWNNFGFQSSYIWDGTSNIVIQICSNNSSWISNGNASVAQSSTSFASSHYFRQDAANVCTSTATGTLVAKRPNIRIVAGSNSNTSSLTINSITANDASNYYIIATNACGSDQSNGATVGLKYAPGLTPISAADDICEDASYAYSTTTSQGTSPITYQWYKDGQAISAATALSYNITSSDTSDAGIYYCKANNVCGSDSTNQSVLTVNEKPVISSQSSSQVVCENQSVSFSITATGSGLLTYQWYKGATPISGATNNTYTVSSASASDAGSYYCKVNNACVSSPVSSTAMSLTVNTYPSISAQTNAVDICAGSAAPFSVTASGTAALTYQWYKGSTAISAATNNTYTISSASSSDAGNYYAVVSNGCGSVNSNSIPLTINTSPSISSQPSALTKCENQSALFNIAANGTAPVTYQWYKGGIAITGANSTSLLISPVSTSDAASYYCIATNSCGTSTSNSVALTVNTGVSISSQSSSTTVCEGSTPTFQLTATGSTPISYQWYNDNGIITSATNSSYSNSSVDTSDAGVYYCVVSNTCSSLSSNSIVLDVNESPTISTQPVSTTVCENLSAVFNVSASGTAPMTYQWYDANGSISGATNSNYIIPQVSSSNVGSYYVKVTNTCGNVTSQSASLSMQQAPSISSQSSSTQVCAGANVSLSVSATGSSPLVYQWYNTAGPIANATANTLTINNSDSSDASTYSVTVSNGCGNVSSNNMVLSVNEAPSIVSQSQGATKCVGTSFSFNVAASGSNPLSYQWYNASGSIAGATNNLYLINALDTTDAGTYYCKVSNSCGNVNSTNKVLIINTAPSIVSQSNSATKCEGNSMLFTLSANGSSPLTYQWYADTGLIAGANSNSYTLNSIVSANAGNYYAKVSNQCGSINSSTKTLTVKSAPSIINQTSSDTICQGMSMIFNVTALGSAPINYQWYKNSSSIPNATNNLYMLTSADTNNIGSYHVVATNVCGNDQSSPIILGVNKLASITYQSGDSSRCEGESVSFEVNASGTNPISYQWYKGGNVINGANSNFYAISNLGGSDASYYKCVVSNVCNNVSSSNKVLTVHAKPVESLGNDTTFCDGGQVILSPGFGYNTSWNNGSFNNQLQVSQSGSYWAHITDQYGCDNYTDTVNVQVVLPYASQELCMVGVDSATQKNIIVYEKVPAVGATSYNIYRESSVTGVWNLIENRPVDSLSVVYDLTSNPIAHADRYAITVVDSCGNESAQSPVHKSMHLAVSPASPSGYNLSWNAYEGFTVASYRIWKADTSMIWNKVDSVNGNIFMWHDTSSAQVPYFYYVEIIRPGGACGPTKANTNYNTSRSNQANNGLAMPSSLSPDFIATPTQGVAPMVVVFYDQTMGNASSWYWNFGDGHTSTLQNPAHQYDSAGVYDVTLTVANADGVNSITKFSFIDVLVDGIELNENPFEIKVFPNPYVGSTRIEYMLQSRNDVNVEVYSALGQLVWSKSYGYQMAGAHHLQFSASQHGFSEGVYYLKMRIGNQQYTYKLVEVK